MKCCQAQKRLIQEAEGALSQRDSEALRLHLLSCEACRREMDELREVTSLFRAAKTPACEPDSQLWSRLESVIQQESAGREKLLRKSWLPNLKPSLGFGTAGAAAVLVVVAYVAAIQPGGDPITPPKSSLPVSSPTAERKLGPLAEAPPAVTDSARLTKETPPSVVPRMLASTAASGPPERSTRVFAGKNRKFWEAAQHRTLLAVNKPITAAGSATTSNFDEDSDRSDSARAGGSIPERPTRIARAVETPALRLDVVSAAPASVTALYADSIDATPKNDAEMSDEAKERAAAVEMVYMAPDSRANTLFSY